nr:MAG TPA: protein of unknown function (DUF4494) [Caudoviricetes sp.]
MSLFAFFFITLHLISRNVIRLYELIKISKKKNMRSRTSTWFETKVKYQKTMEDGSEKVVSEAYVVDALSFTEAESAIIEEMSVYVSGELRVSGIAKSNFGEIFFSDKEDDDSFYICKLQFITLDEKTGKEKRSNVTYLVQAKSMHRAINNIDEVMGKTLIDYEIIGLSKTNVYDVFEHKTKEEKQKSNEEKKEE